MKRLKVLIVEDDAATAFILKKQLTSLGHEVLGIAADYDETISMVEEEAPELIIMDIILRGEKNGIEAASEIFKKTRIPIIFISIPNNEAMLDRAKFIKSCVFLAKPLSNEKLNRTIELILERKPNFLSKEDMERERLSELYRYEVLDTPPEGNFDRITSIAATFFNIPVALVSLVDKDRIWFKSRYGFEEEEIPTGEDMTYSAFLANEFYFIPNVKEDLRAITNPILARNAGFYFYASAPLITKDGYNIGAFSIIDTKPRQFTKTEEKALKDLAEVVMDEMELRLASRRAYKQQREFLTKAIHDLRNPLTGIIGLSDLLNTLGIENETFFETNKQINNASMRMLHIIDDLMETTLLELRKIKLKCISLNLADVADSIIKQNLPRAQSKMQNINFLILDHPIINADPIKITTALDNIVNNAVKFTPEERSIEIKVFEKDDLAHFIVKDEGPGLTEAEMKRIFEKFSRVSTIPSGKETYTGLGLAIAKELVELHGGSIKVSSEGKDKGSTFEVELPVEKPKDLSSG